MSFDKKLSKKFEVEEELRTKCIENMKNAKWSSNPKEFYNSITSSKKHSEMLHPYSEQELKKLKLFKLENFNIGFALKEDEDSIEIISLHNNEIEIKNIGKEIMWSAITEAFKLNPTKRIILDHYDGFLSRFYENLGFEEYKREKFNPQYDPDGKFEEKYGKSDVIYREFTKKIISKK